MDPQARSKLDQIMAQIARQTGATVRAYPQPGHAVRRVILRDIRDGGGTRLASIHRLNSGDRFQVVGRRP